MKAILNKNSNGTVNGYCEGWWIKMALKPTATEITSWQPYKKVFYKCSNCGQDFRMFGNKEHYCHNCGTEVDWSNILTSLPQPFNKNDYNREKELISEINKKQLK